MGASEVYYALRESFCDALRDASYRGHVTLQDARSALNDAWRDWHTKEAQDADRDA